LGNGGFGCALAPALRAARPVLFGMPGTLLSSGTFAFRRRLGFVAAARDDA